METDVLTIKLETDSGNIDEEKLDEHINDKVVHITADERTAWDNHINNSAIHVTAEEKTAWNAKMKCSVSGETLIISSD